MSRESDLLKKESLFELRQVTKAYPGVVALRQVDLEVFPGEVHAVVGLNGAGKSTLVKILAGVVQPDSGKVIGSHAQLAHGSVSLVPQDIVMVPGFSIGRNLLLGIEHRALVRRSLDEEQQALAAQALARVGLRLHPETMPVDCTVPELRLVQMAKALVRSSEVLLLDEPTSVLSEEEAERLLERVAILREEGEAVVYVSHRMGEVVRLADRITVLRDGAKVAELQARQVTREILIDILAKQVEGETQIATETLEEGGSESILEVESLTGPGFRDASFIAHAGEIIALVGIQDAGQSQLVQSLAGLNPPFSGTVQLRGSTVELTSPKTATGEGLVLVPSNRREAGVVGSMDVRENMALSPRSAMQRFGVRRRRRERQVANQYIRRFSIKTPSIATDVAVLSGGNQQKVAIATALEARPEILLLDEPTQGIDVATKSDILARIRTEARATRHPVLAATSELEEVPGWADTALVFRRGRIVSRMRGPEVTEEALLQTAVSWTDDGSESNE